MNRKQKKTVAGIVLVLTVVVVVTVAVVSIVTRTPKPDVVGIYTGQNGREIKLAQDGTFTEIPVSLGGNSGPATLCYWVSGNNITIGDSKSRPNVPPTFKVEGNNRLVGYGTVWVKHLVDPNRPSSLVGTYASSDGESLAIDESGAVYDTQQGPSGGTARGATWVAGKNVVTATFPEKMTYTVNGKNLVGGGKKFVKKSNKVIVPFFP